MLNGRSLRLPGLTARQTCKPVFLNGLQKFLILGHLAGVVNSLRVFGKRSEDLRKLYGKLAESALIDAYQLGQNANIGRQSRGNFLKPCMV